MSSSGHALLSASAAHKWLHCTPSARLEETLPERESTYADEGRLAHSIAELKLRKAFTEPMGPKTFANRLKKLQENPLYQDEMLHHTDAYLDYVSQVVHSYGSVPYVAIEKRLDYSAYAPGGFGTGDCIIIGGATLHVIDLKYGKGVPVSAVGNPQMLLYALGALSAYSLLYGITMVKLVIMQPRLDTVSEYELSVDELLAWGESIKPLAQQAFEGKGEFVPGEHCRFCRAKALCRARSEAHTALEDFKMMRSPLISNEEVGQILQRAQTLAAWVKDLEDYALSECLSGSEIPGWKAVEGRKVRQFTEVDAAFAVLTGAGYDSAVLYERKPITLTAVEKLLGKTKFGELLSAHVTTPPGKPALAPATDKREPITRVSAQDDFNKEVTENE